MSDAPIDPVFGPVTDEPPMPAVVSDDFVIVAPPAPGVVPHLQHMTFTGAPVPPPAPAPNVILEYREQPGEEHLTLYLAAMDYSHPSMRPSTVTHGGRTFAQARIGSGGLWVYAS